MMKDNEKGKAVKKKKKLRNKNKATKQLTQWTFSNDLIIYLGWCVHRNFKHSTVSFLLMKCIDLSHVSYLMSYY